MKLCVYGGQYGSEGKGSVAEYLIREATHLHRPEAEGERPKRDLRLVALGENSPNSGHTCSLGKTRNIPASSYYADTVLLGPDSAVNIEILLADLTNIRVVTGKAPRVYIHEHAAVVCQMDIDNEQHAGVIERVSSTGSGSGSARYRKGFKRVPDAVIKTRHLGVFADNQFEVSVISRWAYLKLLEDVQKEDCIFECSQGTLLDTNWGIFPYVTSRSTLPRTAIDRNGVATIPWSYCGVYRTFPIRTGGPSGPTGGDEITFESLGVADEIATVTKRTRRIFKFNREDFYLSLHLTRPHMVFFTHLDYIGVKPTDLDGFFKWYLAAVDLSPLQWRVDGLFLSDTTGQFINHGSQVL